jgi:diketogulonate reductase-like aldo/keto reductase
MLSNTTSPPFGAAALWAAQIPQCLRQGKPKNWARRQFGCTQAATYAYNNAKMALCQHGSCEASIASSLRRVESAHEACERFSCSPEDLLHLRTSQPKPSNNFLGCTGTTRTGKDWGVCTAYLKEVRALVQRHRKALASDPSRPLSTKPSPLSSSAPRPPTAIPSVRIGSGGAMMPSLCYGLGHLAGQPIEAERLSLVAIRAGYRCFDTSMLYDGTEEALGRAWRASGLARSAFFFKTKLLTWDDDDEHKHALDDVGGALAASLRRLQTSYVDVYMLHVAYRSERLLVETWPRLAKLKAAGKIRHLGVANADAATLEAFLGAAKREGASGALEYWQGKVSVYTGAVGALGNGFPSSRHVDDRSIAELAKVHGVVIAAFNVVSAHESHSTVLNAAEDPHVLALAAAKHVSAHQLLASWAVAHGHAILIGSSNEVPPPFHTQSHAFR